MAECAEHRLEEIELEVASKLTHKTLRSETQRLWAAGKLGKQANYLQFISLLRNLQLIEGSEVSLINELWRAAGGKEGKGVNRANKLCLVLLISVHSSLLDVSTSAYFTFSPRVDPFLKGLL